MSIISDVVYKHIYQYDKEKRGEWLMKEPPPPNTFDISDIRVIVRNIISELEGILSDKVFSKSEAA